MIQALSDSLCDIFTRRHRYRRVVRELSNLSERELNDIGISRSDIQRIAKEATNASL